MAKGHYGAKIETEKSARSALLKTKKNSGVNQLAMP